MRGESDVARLLARGREVLAEAGVDSIDYLAVVDAESLVPLERLDARPARALVAAFVGPTRLIDNVEL